MQSIKEKNEANSAQVAQRLERHPEVMARMQRLLDVMENTDGDVRRADEAERRAIDELCAMGQEALQGWGINLAQKEAQTLQASGGVVRQGKKLHWYSTFGEIEVVEQTYIDKCDGQLRRPFEEPGGCQRIQWSKPCSRTGRRCALDSATNGAAIRRARRVSD